MTDLFDQTFDRSFAAFGDGFETGSQLIAKRRRHADGLPVQIVVPIVQSFSFASGDVLPRRNRFELLYQKLMPFHLAEFDSRIESCRVPIKRIDNRFKFVPVKGVEGVDENSLAKVLTFGQAKLQLCDPLLLTQVWPLVTTVVDDALLRCSTVAWLYSPDLGTFPAESLTLSECVRQPFLAFEKSLLCEVNDDHRT